MNLIADGGITTKNTLTYTKGAISLTISTDYIDGVALDIAYTIDDVFIMYDRDSLLLTTQGKGYFQTSTYNDLLHYNIGTKVLNDREILNILKNTPSKARIGVIINDNNRDEINNDYDFYVINDYGVNKDLILKKMNANKDIMTELIQYPNDLINAYYTYGKYILFKLFIIAKEPKALYDTFKEIQARV